MRISSPLLGFALALAASSQQPQQNPTPNAATDPKNASTLEGRVLNAITGEPIRRVNLALRPFGAPGISAGIGPGSQQQAAPFAATTDADGKFHIEKVDPGAYRLMAERQGFVRQEYGARLNSMMGTTINVPPGQTLKDLNFKLTPQAVVKGRVLDDEGEPLARVQVQVLRRRYFRGKQQLVPMGGGQTLDTGEFRIADLAPGRYWIGATYRSRTMMFGEAAARNTTGQPEEEYVTTYYPNAIEESSARPIDLEAGQEMSGIDIPLRKARVFRIRGKIGGGAQPVRGMRVMLMPRDRGMGIGSFGANSAMVKEDGSFEIGSVPPGSYHVAAMVAQGMMSVHGKAPVDVSREDVENVTIPLTGGAGVRGAIRLDGNNSQQVEQAQTTKPTFGSVRVQLIPMDGIAFNAPNAVAKDDGSFLIESAGADRFRVSVYNLPQGTWLKSVRAGDREVLETGMDLTAGAPAQIEIVLGSGVGQVSGLVRDAKQQAAAGAMITLLPSPMKEERNDLYKLVSADQNGQFTLQGIAPGEYQIFAWEEIDPGRYTDPEFLKTHESAATKVSVKANGQAQVNLVQVPAEITNAKQ
jgi:hypothetical protein